MVIGPTRRGRGRARPPSGRPTPRPRRRPARPPGSGWCRRPPRPRPAVGGPRRDQARPAGRRDHDVRLPGDGGEVGGTRVADGHRGVPVEQQVRQRLADDRGAADDRDRTARERDAVRVEELDDGLGGGGREGGQPGGEPAQAERVGAVHVLAGASAAAEFGGGRALGQRRLEDDAVHGRVGAEPFQRPADRRGFGVGVAASRCRRPGRTFAAARARERTYQAVDSSSRGDHDGQPRLRAGPGRLGGRAGRLRPGSRRRWPGRSGPRRCPSPVNRPELPG